MKSKLLKQEKGFTIIEVLIVLAIAGLIMLIVFLAIPQLQRNSRNNARNADSSRISTNVTECLANRNGQNASCMNTTNINITPGTDTREIEAVGFANGGATAPTPPSGTNIHQFAYVWHQRVCNADGSGSSAGTTRQFVVVYTLENNITRCISS